MCIWPQWLSKLNWFKLIRPLKCFWCLICFPTCLSRYSILVYLGLIEWFVSKGPNEIKSLKLKMYYTWGPTIVHFQVHSRERKFLSVCSTHSISLSNKNASSRFHRQMASGFYWKKASDAERVSLSLRHHVEYDWDNPLPGHNGLIWWMRLI